VHTASRAATEPARPLQPQGPMPLVLVANPGSAGADAERLQAAIGALRQAGVPVQLLQAEHGAEVPQLAERAARLAAAEAGAVVAVGGDGTINAVAAAVLRAGCPMGVLPQGTFNYFARCHGLPDDPEAAVRVWRAGHAVPVQVGAVNGRPFVVNASLGLYPEILRAREADSAAHGRKRWVALWSAARTALRSRQVLRASLLFIGNNRLQIENLGLPQAHSVGDDRLAAIRVAPVGWAAMLRLMLLGALGALGGKGRLSAPDEVNSTLFDELTITPTRRLARRRLQVACDGEVAWMETPLHVQVLPERLLLLCPRPE
jgi:diacylglycerol kinase family enzyme